MCTCAHMGGEGGWQEGIFLYHSASLIFKMRALTEFRAHWLVDQEAPWLHLSSLPNSEPLCSSMWSFDLGTGVLNAVSRLQGKTFTDRYFSAPVHRKHNELILHSYEHIFWKLLKALLKIWIDKVLPLYAFPSQSYSTSFLLSWA